MTNESPHDHPVSSNEHLVDLEKVFFRLHARIIRSFTSLYGVLPLRIAEWISLFVALLSLFTLIHIHMEFVQNSSRSNTLMCLSESLLEHVELGRERLGNNIDIIHILDKKPPDVTLPVYTFAKDRGLLCISPSTKQRLNIQEFSLPFDKLGSCFGNHEAFTWRLMSNVVGFETVIINMFIKAFEGEGYMHLESSRKDITLAHYSNVDSTILFKVGVILASTFLVLVTTTLVHHTLRETQERMLHFTAELKLRLAHDIPFKALVLNHVLGSLVFIPSMAGILFFLVEFYSDHLMAFTVLSAVWCCEAYSSISLRTQPSIAKFPKHFMLYFGGFHIYFFTFPSGFSHVALAVFVTFQIHSLLFFWSRYEVPALLNGAVNARSFRYVALSPSASPNSSRVARPSVITANQSARVLDNTPQSELLLNPIGTGTTNNKPGGLRRRHSIGTTSERHSRAGLRELEAVARPSGNVNRRLAFYSA